MQEWCSSQLLLLLFKNTASPSCQSGRYLEWQHCYKQASMWSTAWGLRQGLMAALGAPTLPSHTEQRSTLVQSFTSVTGDVARAAMILEEFFEKQQDGCNLTSQLQQLLTEKAAAASTAVEKQLDKVLWWYSMLWFPLMLVLLIIWATSRSTARDKQGHAAVPASLISKEPGTCAPSSGRLTRRPSSAASNSSKLAAARQ